MDHTSRSPSPIPMQRLNIRTTSHDAPAQAGPSNPQVSPLPAGGGPVSPVDLQAISRELEEAFLPSSPGSATPSDISTEEHHAVPADLQVQRDRLDAVRAGGGGRIGVLAEQFRLEAAAVRAVLGKQEDIDSLASGDMTAQAVKGDLSSGMHTLLSRHNLYQALNTGADTPVGQPFALHELAAAGIGASDGERELHRLTLTHEAYGRVLADLNRELDGASSDAARAGIAERIGDVKLAHQAFKHQVAATECQLEEAQRDLQIAMEMASNKIPFLKTQAEREQAVAAIAPHLKLANDALAVFSAASDIILPNEHAADHRRRALTSEDSYVSATIKIFKQLVMAGLTQGVSSAIHWGYGRTGGALLVDHLLPHVGGVLGILASSAVQGVALGVSHKAWTDGPRELLHTAAEAGGIMRPVVPSEAHQLFPRVPRCTLDEAGNPVAIPDEVLRAHDASNEEARKTFGDQSKKYAFGNVGGNFRGETAFGIAQGAGDAVALQGFAGADSIHGRAVRSLGGGTGMTFTQEIGKEGHHVLGQPTHVEAKRANPRGVVHRVVTAAQKLDLGQEANRLDGYNKIYSAGFGIAGAEAIDTLGSAPLRQLIDQTDSDTVRDLAKAGHVGLESVKPYPTLNSFFSGQSVVNDAKTVPGESSANWKRMVVGPRNALNPARDAATSAYPKGTHGYRRQVVDTFFKSSAQAIAQPFVVGTEVMSVGMLKLARAGVAKLIDLGHSDPLQQPPDLEAQRQ